MKPIEVPDYDDDRIYVPFTIPQKNREPLVFKVPRRDFQAPEEVKTLQWLMSELDVDEDKLRELVDLDTELNRVVAIEKACFLLALKPHVTAEQFEQLRNCSFGQLRFINDRWNEQSRVTLGEYWASAGSSKASTPRPSSTTSSAEAGTSGTLDGDSDGQSSEA